MKKKYKKISVHSWTGLLSFGISYPRMEDDPFLKKVVSTST